MRSPGEIPPARPAPAGSMQAAGFVLASWAVLAPVLSVQGQAVQLPMEPQRESGQGVTGAYEGWFKNPDGSFSMLVGYFNRNLKEELEIPVGPNNAIQPGGPDRGQPTHFFTGRQWGVFTISVPKDFGAATKLTWTLIAHGQTTTIPLSLNPLWEVSPFSEAGVGNTPPVISFEHPGGPSVQGPLALTRSAVSTTEPNPLTLTVWVADDAKVAPGSTPPRTPPVTVTWNKFRGPGVVKFDPAKPAVEKIDAAPPAPAYSGKATTTATFSEPGDYVLLVVANDWSGDGGRGFQCCWTTAEVKVSVKPAGGGR
jgi:hypothetical protein